MNIKTEICAASLLLPIAALAQAYNPATGQRYDAYGRPVPSVESLCREAQMAGGPITQKCAMYGFRFNAKGEKLVTYQFDKWGYNVADMGVTEKDAQRLDSDPAFRAKYIKQHGYEKYKLKDQALAQ